MALTIGEAQAVNDLIRYTLALRAARPPATAGQVQSLDLEAPGLSHEDELRARAGARLLAGKAHRPLMAGLTADDVDTLWVGSR